MQVFFALRPFLYQFLKRKRVFCFCPQSEISTISLDESKANAHAGMPFLRYVSVCYAGFLAGLWSYDQGQQPVWGVGRLRLSSRGSREPHFDKCNDLRLFCFHKIWHDSLQSRGRIPDSLIESGYDFCIRKTHRAETRATWCATTCGIYSRGII